MKLLHNQHGNETGVSPPPTEIPDGRRARVRASGNWPCVCDAPAAGTVPPGVLRNVRNISSCQRTPLNIVEDFFSFRFISRNVYACTEVEFGCVYSAYAAFYFEQFGRLFRLIVSAHPAFFV